MDKQQFRDIFEFISDLIQENNNFNSDYEKDMMLHKFIFIFHTNGFTPEFIPFYSLLINYYKKKLYSMNDTVKEYIKPYINFCIHYYFENKEYINMIRDIDLTILIDSQFEYPFLAFQMFLNHIEENSENVQKYFPERRNIFKKLIYRNADPVLMMSYANLTFDIALCLKKVNNSSISLNTLEDSIKEMILAHKKFHDIENTLLHTNNLKEKINIVMEYGSNSKPIADYLKFLNITESSSKQISVEKKIEKKVKKKPDIKTINNPKTSTNLLKVKAYKLKMSKKIKKKARNYRYFCTDEEKTILEKAHLQREEAKQKKCEELQKKIEIQKKLEIQNQEKASLKAKEIEQIKDENIKATLRKKNESVISKNIYYFLKSSEFEIYIGCSECYPYSTIQKCFLYNVTHHKCDSDRLMLRKCNQFIYIRDPPRQIKLKRNDIFIDKIKLCENYLNGKECQEKNNCPNPHTDVEKNLWAKYFSSSNGIYQEFVEDMKSSKLVLREIIEDILKKKPGKLEMVCKHCLKDEKKVCYKKKHVNECLHEKAPHPWNENAILVLNIDSKCINKTDFSLLFKPAYDKNFDDIDIYDVSKQLTQQIYKNKLLNEPDENVNVAEDLNELKICNDPDEIIDSNVEEMFLKLNYKQNSDIDYTKSKFKKTFYEILSDNELQIQLEEKPYWFRQGIIRLINPVHAQCTFTDGKNFNGEYEEGIDENNSLSKEEKKALSNLSEVEIRGRSNCGQAFNEDEVIVKIKKTKEVGDDGKYVYRGTVVKVTKESFNRHAYIYLCQVDAYISHLMKPIDGIAPKFHVRHHELIEHFADDKFEREQYVSKYVMKEDSLILDKTIKLNPKLRQELLFLVIYERWGPNSMYPFGYVCGIIKRGENLKDSQTVLNILYQIPTSPNEISECAAKKIDSEIDLSSRTDFRKKFTISIDPENCKDVDDAVSIEKISDDLYEIMVHISDVTAFVKKGDDIDKDAFKRAFSYYSALPSVYAMLPKRLSEDMCSLLKDEDRLAISVKFNIKSDGTISENKSIYKSIIRNKLQLSYEKAQDILNKLNVKNMNAVDEALHLLRNLTQKIRKNRLDNGYFYCSDSDNPFENNPCYETHQMIEELMILTNKVIAKFIVDKFPESAPLRIHDQPNERNVNNFIKNFANVMPCSFYFNSYSSVFSNETHQSEDSDLNNMNNTDLETDTDDFIEVKKNIWSIDEPVSLKSIALLMSTINKLKYYLESKEAETTKYRNICNIVGTESKHPDHRLAMRTWWKILDTSRFVCNDDVKEDPFHFGLQTEYYVQFTSPIRRYMDVIVHRYVTAALNEEDAPYTKKKKVPTATLR